MPLLCPSGAGKQEVQEGGLAHLLQYLLEREAEGLCCFLSHCSISFYILFLAQKFDFSLKNQEAILKQIFWQVLQPTLSSPHVYFDLEERQRKDNTYNPPYNYMIPALLLWCPFASKRNPQTSNSSDTHGMKSTERQSVCSSNCLALSNIFREVSTGFLNNPRQELYLIIILTVYPWVNWNMTCLIQSIRYVAVFVKPRSDTV